MHRDATHHPRHGLDHNRFVLLVGQGSDVDETIGRRTMSHQRSDLCSLQAISRHSEGQLPRWHPLFETDVVETHTVLDVLHDLFDLCEVGTALGDLGAVLVLLYGRHCEFLCEIL